jgi:hypothetical protein
VINKKKQAKISIIIITRLLGLMLSFEFVTYLLHPFIVIITWHIPALVVLGSVVVAAGLLPFHHRLEHWVEKEMGGKRKKHGTPKPIQETSTSSGDKKVVKQLVATPVEKTPTKTDS